MAIAFKAQLREPGFEAELDILAATHSDAAYEAMRLWVAAGHVGVDQMPVEVITTTTLISPHAERFLFEAPPPFVHEPIHACRECGCSDDDACDPPCAWVEDDLCDAPQCVAAAAGQP